MEPTVVVCNPADAQLVARALRAAGAQVAVIPRDAVRPGQVHGLAGSYEVLSPVLRRVC